MLYTIIPEDVVLENLETVQASRETTYKGRRFLVQPYEHHRYQVVQLISSDPNDFLLPEFAPGSIIPGA